MADPRDAHLLDWLEQYPELLDRIDAEDIAGHLPHVARAMLLAAHRYRSLRSWQGCAKEIVERFGSRLYPNTDSDSTIDNLRKLAPKAVKALENRPLMDRLPIVPDSYTGWYASPHGLRKDTGPKSLDYPTSTAFTAYIPAKPKTKE